MKEKRTVTGLVEEIGQNKKTLKVNGKWYKTSSRTEGNIPSKGEQVHLVVNGNWVDKIDVISEKTRENGYRNGKNGARVTIHVRPQSENKLIARQTALKTASEIAVAAIQSGKMELTPELGDLILNTANEFYQWLVKPNGGQ